VKGYLQRSHRKSHLLHRILVVSNNTLYIGTAVWNTLRIYNYIFRIAKRRHFESLVVSEGVISVIHTQSSLISIVYHAMIQRQLFGL